jgi:hypothetical protein
MNLDRRTVLAGLGVCVASPSLALQTNVDHEVVEAAWLIAGLTPLGRDGGSLSRDTAYWRAAEDWFANYTDHRVVKLLGADFNLPRWIGNAANYSFVGSHKLQRTPAARPMWDDPNGDLFTRYRSETESFLKECRARLFLRDHAETFAAVRKALFEAVDLEDMQRWLENEFSARPSPMEIYVSPMTGGWNFTNLDSITPRLWVPAVRRLADDYDRFIVVASVFTEVNHNYVNPVTSSLSTTDYSYFTSTQGWATPQAWDDYGTPELVLNEYMTWAAYLFYARDRISGDILSKIEARTIKFMEQQRGFPKFGLFVNQLTQHRNSLNATLERCYGPTLTSLKE